METTVQALAITEEQIQAIIADTASKLQDIIDWPISDYERRYNRGSENLEGELEEICYEGIPGIGEDSDIDITASFEGTCDWHDDYDAGDYWTPPSGGIEIDDVEVYITDMKIEISVYDEESDEYVEIEVTSEVLNRIIEEVNKKVV